MMPIISTTMQVCKCNLIGNGEAKTAMVSTTHEQIGEGEICANTPLYDDGMIFHTMGYGGGSWLYRLTKGGRRAELVWHNVDLDNLTGGVVKVGDYIYGSGYKNNAWFCVDWKTGKTMHRDRQIGRSSVIFADEMLYCYAERGSVHLVKPNPNNLEIVNSFKITMGTDQHFAHPVIHRGVLYIRQGNTLMAYKIK